jgi:hypothetical protein
MKLSAFALALMLIAGTASAQKPDSPASQTGKTASESSQTPKQGSNSASTEKATSANELKTQSFKGTVVDLACGDTSNASSSADRKRPSDQPLGSTTKSGATKGEADRSANAGFSCSISSSSGEFALQTKDGRTLRFDAVGNERVKQELLNRKSWASASAAGKPIQATVNGTETGDSLMVLSIR